MPHININPRSLRDDPDARRLSQRLGWLSLGLGVAEILAPRQVAKIIGAPPSTTTVRSLRLIGLRDAAIGIVILMRPGRAWPIWARVAGDAVDLTLMSRAADDLNARRRLVYAAGAAAGLTALDIGSATALTGAPRFARRMGRFLHQPEENIMASEQNLRALLAEDIRDMYDAERQLTKALPKFARAATSDALRDALEQHLEETEGQIGQLEEIFEALGQKPHTKRCAGMAGILEEGLDFIHGDYDGAVLDAAIIAMVQRAEHYEITAYGSCVAWARALGLSNVSSMLSAMLEEEKAVDRTLSALAEGGTNLAEGGINNDAAEESVEVEAETDAQRVARMTPESRHTEGGHQRHPRPH